MSCRFPRRRGEGRARTETFHHNDCEGKMMTALYHAHIRASSDQSLEHRRSSLSSLRFRNQACGLTGNFGDP